MLKKIALIALASASIAAFPMSSASAATTLVNFSLNAGVVSLASGTFSYDSAKTGQLDYTDLQSFTFNLPSTTYDLAFVNSGNDSVYKYFGFNATTQQFVSATIAGYPEILSDLKANLDNGFFVRQDPAYTIFADYRVGTAAIPYTNISVSSVTGAVPEPATWAMMIAGFGMIGFAARKRSSVKTTVAYA